MNAKVDFGNGNIVELSEESTEKLKLELLKSPFIKQIIGEHLAIYHRKGSYLVIINSGFAKNLIRWEGETIGNNLKESIETLSGAWNYTFSEVRKIIAVLQKIIGENQNE